MKVINRHIVAQVLVLLALVEPTATGVGAAFGQCAVRETTRKFEGADRTIVTMENAKILVEIAPELNGRIIRYVDKSRKDTPLEWLDDCVYHYGGRWEGKPFTYRIDAPGPDRAAVTVMGGGKLAVALLRTLGYDIANPLETSVERTMSIDAESTRLHIHVKITNTGDGVAPQLRYMVHSVYGQVPPLPSGGRAFWFLPTAEGVEFFDDKRGLREMRSAAGGAPVDHPFSRFIRGQKADKPRFEARGWGAVLTAAGPNFIYYDPAKYDFMQFWFGGDASWHFTFEPHSKPVDLKPGESTECEFTLAYDSADVPFITSTVAYEQPQVSDFATPGSAISIKSRATTVARNQNTQAKIKVEIKDPSGKPILEQDLAGDLRPFEFVDLNATANLPQEAPLGKYTWTAKLADGKSLGSGKIEVLSTDDLERRKTETAIASLRAEYDVRLRKLEKDLTEAHKADRRWNDGMNLALSLDDPRVWPREPVAEVSTSIRHGAIRVQGLWKGNESVRFNQLQAAAAPVWPSDVDHLLAPLRADRSLVRDLALTPDGKRVVALVVDAAKNRAEIVCWDSTGQNLRRFGHYSDKPDENNDTLGAVTRALAVDAEGNVWVATNAWGQTSRYAVNQDGAPFEESILGAKGAVKKFSLAGKLLGTISTLDAPMDLLPATADGQAVILASYRHVSSYYGAQVKEGVMIIGQANVKRLAEIKIPAGSVCVDRGGRIWSADVAGHLACYDLRGKKLLDVAASAPPAVLDAKLPAGSPLPVIVRSSPGGGCWALATLKHNLTAVSQDGQGSSQPVPTAAGPLWRLVISGDNPLILGEKTIWSP